MPVELTPLINGQSYGWADIAFNINGSPVTGITAIKYTDEQEKSNVYGAGRRPIRRGKGRIKTSVSITLAVEEVMAITRAAPKKSLTAVPPFSIIVMYQPEAGPVVKDVIKNCEFMKNERDWKEGDHDSKVTIELIASHIEWDS
jgi:hypothetical protein